MATYTAPLALGDGLGYDGAYQGPYSSLTASSATVVSGYAAGIGTDSTYQGPYSALSPASATIVAWDAGGVEAGTWSGASTRAAAGAGAVGYDSTFQGAYSSLSPTPAATTGIDPGGIGSGLWDGPSGRTAGDLDPGGAVAGTFIPSAYFRRVSGVVRDEDGEPITDASHIVTTSSFMTAGDVDEAGVYQIYLLYQDYSEFYVITESDAGQPYQWARLDLDDYNPIIDTGTENQDLYFDTTTPRPVDVGHGLNIGGPLG